MLVTLVAGFGDSQKSYLFDMTSMIESFFGCEVLKLEWHHDVAQRIRDQQPNNPLVMVGHSFGGAACVKAAEQLNPDITVDSMVLLDPVPTDGWFVPDLRDFKLPSNVKQAACLLRHAWLPPWSRPIKSASCPFHNTYLSMSHGAFKTDQSSRFTVLSAIMAVAIKEMQQVFSI